MSMLRSGAAVIALSASVLFLALADRAEAAFPGANGKIVFASGSRSGGFDIYVMDPDGSDRRRLTTHRKDDFDPAWSPDGKKIVFVGERRGNQDIFVMNADGTNQRRLTRSRGDDFAPSWSPDGKKIAFASEGKHGNWQIYVMNANGTKLKRLTKNAALDADPAWSPEGKKIAFSSDRDGNFEIYVMNANGKQPRRLTNSRGVDEFPAWSPDGKKIAFSSKRKGNSDVYVMNANGSKQKQLTKGKTQDLEPAWSPDGNWIVFDSRRRRNRDVYAIRPNGSGLQRLTKVFDADFSADWQRLTPFDPAAMTLRAADLPAGVSIITESAFEESDIVAGYFRIFNTTGVPFGGSQPDEGRNTVRVFLDVDRASDEVSFLMGPSGEVLSFFETALEEDFGLEIENLRLVAAFGIVAGDEAAGLHLAADSPQGSFEFVCLLVRVGRVASALDLDAAPGAVTPAGLVPFAIVMAERMANEIRGRP